MNTKVITNSNGITVAQLQKWVMTLPTVDNNGEPLQVWVGNGQGNSNPCTSLWPLNIRNNTHDILLEIGKPKE